MLLEFVKLYLEYGADRQVLDLSRWCTNKLKDFNRKEDDTGTYRTSFFHPNGDKFDFNVTFERRFPKLYIKGNAIRTKKEINLYVRLPSHFEISELIPEFIPYIKDAIKHEIEHLTQQSGGSLRMRPAVDRKNVAQVFDQVASYVAYLSSPKESIAWAVGIMKAAKTQRIPVSYELLRRRDEFIKQITGLSEQLPGDAKNLFIEDSIASIDRAFMVIANRMEKRYPASGFTAADFKRELDKQDESSFDDNKTIDIEDSDIENSDVV